MSHAVLLVFAFTACATLPGVVEKPTADERYQALAQRYEEAFEAFEKASAEANQAGSKPEGKSLADQQAAATPTGFDPRAFAGDFMSLAKAHPGTPAAEDALVWVAAHVIYGPETEEAKRLLVREHIASAKLVHAFEKQVHTPGSVATEQLLRQAHQKSPHREVRGLAGYWLGRFLKEQAAAARFARTNPNPLEGKPSVIVDGWGANFFERLQRLDPNALDAEAERIFAYVAKVYGDVPLEEKAGRHKTLGAAASSDLHEYRALAIGRMAPEIAGEDLEGVRFKLSDYRGKVVVLEFGSHFY